MDIAEIRKKAKKGKSANKSSAVSSDATTQASVNEEQLDDVSTDSTASGFDLEDPSDAPTQSVLEDAVGVPADGLDKLFSGTDTLELATEESYHEVISSQGEQQTIRSHQYLAFNLGQEEYALDIKRISEIIKVREFTDIPRVPDFILGIISLRGVVVPVFDLMKRFRLGETRFSSSSRIIVCQEGELQAGLLVDSINQVIDLVDDDIEPPPAILSGLDRDLVKGVGRFQGRMLILLHLASVLDVDQSRDS
jgi:purine-binding chemotaxis protein CheW